MMVATLEQSGRTRPTGRGPPWRRRSGLSPSTIGRISRQFELKPHVQDFFKLSTDPQFVDKVVDVVELYHHPGSTLPDRRGPQGSFRTPDLGARPPTRPERAAAGELSRRHPSVLTCC